MNLYTQVFLRSTLAFVTLFFLAKLLGKKLISRMTLFDFTTGITLGSLASILSVSLTVKPGPIFLGLIIWGIYAFTIDLLALKFRKVRRFVEDSPLILIKDGKILEENMGRAKFNNDDLMMRLREKNIFNISDVEYALLETDGKLSVLPKSQMRPVKPADINLPTGYEGLPTELIVDGKVVYQNLEQAGLDLQWLKDQLSQQKVNSVQDVNLAQLTTDGKLYIDKKSDNFQSKTEIKD